MTRAEAYKAALEAAAKVAENSVDQECCGEHPSHRCCGMPNIYPHNPETIAVAIRALPVPEDDGEAVQAAQWQPIETAPKGGGADSVDDPAWIDPPSILLLFSKGEMCVAYWDWYYAEGGRGCTDGMAWVACAGGELASLYYDAPTHWMPLPGKSVPEDAGDMVIKKRGMYYRPNRQGYTSNISEAGRFTLEEAERETHPNGPDGPRDGMDYEKAPSPAQDMVMVPKDPTPEMLEAASGHYLLASIYRAMIRAAGGKK